MKKILTHIEMSRKGGKAGTGAAKARTSKQARKAALARWQKQKGETQHTAVGYQANVFLGNPNANFVPCDI